MPTCATRADKWVKRWKVQSETDPDTFYTVAVDADGNYGCSCPAWKFRRQECKHIANVKAFPERYSEQIQKPKPEYVLAAVWKPTYVKKENKLLIPLVAIGDTHMEATICYYLLKYGYTMQEIREMRHYVPRQWTASAIIGYIQVHGEASRDPRPSFR